MCFKPCIIVFAFKLVSHYLTSLQLASCAGSQCLVKRTMKPTSNVAKNMPEPWDFVIVISTFDKLCKTSFTRILHQQAWFFAFLFRRIRGTWWTVKPSPTRPSLSICVKEKRGSYESYVDICCRVAIDVCSCVKGFRVDNSWGPGGSRDHK